MNSIYCNLFVKVADKGITTEELASSVLNSLNAVNDALVTIESRYKTIDEIESKFDEVIENLNELKKLTRFKGVLQDLCKRHLGSAFLIFYESFICTKTSKSIIV